MENMFFFCRENNFLFFLFFGRLVVRSYDQDHYRSYWKLFYKLVDNVRFRFIGNVHDFG